MRILAFAFVLALGLFGTPISAQMPNYVEVGCAMSNAVGGGFDKVAVESLADFSYRLGSSKWSVVGGVGQENNSKSGDRTLQSDFEVGIVRDVNAQWWMGVGVQNARLEFPNAVRNDTSVRLYTGRNLGKNLYAEIVGQLPDSSPYKQRALGVSITGVFKTRWLGISVNTGLIYAQSQSLNFWVPRVGIGIRKTKTRQSHQNTD